MALDRPATREPLTDLSRIRPLLAHRIAGGDHLTTRREAAMSTHVTETIHVTTANICHLPLRATWRVKGRCAQAMRHGGANAAVVGQEIADKRYANIWHQAALRTHRETYGLGDECPVSVPTGWHVVDHAVVVSHGGLDTVSPHRVITSTKSLTLEEFKVAVLGCHTVSKPRPGVDHATWRIEHWHEYLADLDRLVTKLHRQGYTAIWAGDFNSRHVPSLHKGERHLAQSGYDYVRVLPAAGVGVKVLRPKVSPASRRLGMDHPLVTGGLQLVRTAA